MSLTTNRDDECLNEKKDNGQNECYLVLSDEEIAKGFVRPVRTSYVHVGKKVDKNEGEIITLEEALIDHSDFAKETYTKENGWAAYIKYPESKSPLTGRFIKEDEYEILLKNGATVGGCGFATEMNVKLAETYARDPKFYGATFCVGCGKHLPVEEFVWSGTEEVVGS